MTAASASTATPLTLERLREDVARMLREPVGEIGLDDNLMDWGLDSLRLLNLVITWNEGGLQLDMSELAGDPTLNALWRVVQARQERTDGQARPTSA